MINPKHGLGIAAAVLAVWTSPSQADWVAARCDVYPVGSDHVSTMIGCTFGQRQGAVTITRDDGVVHELSPVGDTPGNFRDQQGNAAYRQSGLGDQGQIFRLKDESVYVYWDASALEPPPDEENWTAPFTTAEYDATTRLNCRAAGATDVSSCPAGILRMEGGQASIVVQSPKGEQFTLNFMTGNVNATNGEVDARLEGDVWFVKLDNGEQYEVPRAAIEGG